MKWVFKSHIRHLYSITCEECYILHSSHVIYVGIDTNVLEKRNLFFISDVFTYFLYIWNISKCASRNGCLFSEDKFRSRGVQLPFPRYRSEFVISVGWIDLSTDNEWTSLAWWVNKDAIENKISAWSIQTASSGKICLENMFAFSYGSLTIVVMRGILYRYLILVGRFQMEVRLVYRLHAILPRCRSRDALCWTLTVKGILAYTVCRGEVRSRMLEFTGGFTEARETLPLGNHVRHSGMP